MKEKTLYQCEICETWYQVKALALSCEASNLPLTQLQVGQEVKLKNRNTGYTLAIITKLVIGPGYSNLSNIDLETYQEHLSHPKGKEWQQKVEHSKYRHEWLIVLDREVMLDHKWEDYKNTVGEHNILSEEKAQGVLRDDNNCH
jgi:hypothetical protein